MKRLLFFVGLLALTTVFNSCTKEKEPDPAVVGTWNLDRIVVAGLAGNFASYNKSYTPSTFGVESDSYVVRNDKTFTETVRAGTVENYNGSWEFSGSTLNLKYDSGNSEDLTLNSSTTPNELNSKAYAVSDTLRNPVTGAAALQSYTIQYFFKKQ